MLPEDYQNTEFPGEGGLSSPKIDKFIDLIDSLTTRRVPLDETAFAEFYNKMANAVMQIEEYIQFEEGDNTCPTSENRININTDDSVESISTPRTFSVNLLQVGKFLHPTFPLSIQGSILPFEFVITNDPTAYTNQPIKDMTIFDPAFVEIANNSTVYATCSVDLKRKSDGRPFLEPMTHGLYGGYNGYHSYLYSLCVHYNTYVNPDSVIVRGFIRDRAAQGLTVNQKTIIENLGPLVELHCGVTVVN